MEEIHSDCSWQEVYKLNGIVLNEQEDFDSLELDEIDTIVVGFNSPIKAVLRFEIPELVMSQRPIE